MSDRELAERTFTMLADLTVTLEKFRPLLDKYERASAVGVFQARKIMKEGSTNGRG